MPIPKLCLTCKTLVADGQSRCTTHRQHHEHQRQSRQPYRAGYQTSTYRQARKIALDRAHGKCWCGQPATETHHTIPLSQENPTNLTPRDLSRRLQAVCRQHNPRGGKR